MIDDIIVPSSLHPTQHSSSIPYVWGRCEKKEEMMREKKMVETVAVATFARAILLLHHLCCKDETASKHYVPTQWRQAAAEMKTYKKSTI